jgi:ArsR family transcriptional regulator
MQSLEHAAQRLRVLAHPLRLKLLEQLLKSPASVGELTDLIHQPQAITSQHLSLLRLHNLVARRRQGRTAVYRVADPDVAGLIAWIHRGRYAAGFVEGGAAI